MMMMGFGELLLLLAIGGGGLPLGVPPMAEDAKLMKVAPDNAMIYLHGAGVAAPDPDSKNRTVAFAAEPEVLALIKAIDDSLTDLFKAEMRGEEEQVLAQHMPFLVRTGLSRPAVFYLTNIAMGPRGPTFGGALVVNCGDKKNKVRQSMIVVIELLRQELGAQGDPGRLPNNQGGLELLPAIPGAPQMAWGFVGDYLVFSFGKQAPAQVYSALTDNNAKEAAWLSKLKKALPTERNSAIVHFNVEQFLGQLGPMMGLMPGGEGQKVMQAMGLDKVHSLSTVTGLSKDGFTTKSMIGIKPEENGKPKLDGLLALFRGKPLEAADLKTIPGDASVAMVARVDLAEMYLELILKMNQIDPKMAEDFTGEMVAMEKGLGFRLVEDLFQNLGDTWSLYNSPGEGGLLFTGLTLTVPIKDREKLLKVNETMVKKFKEMAGPEIEERRWGRRHNRGMFVKAIKHGEHTIYMANPVGLRDDVFVAPSWCVADKHLVVALYPQMIKAFLDRKADAPTLESQPDVNAALAAGKSGPYFTRVDTPELMKKGYPLMHAFAVLFCGEMQREGMFLDASKLPSAATVLRHLKPEHSHVRVTADGIVMDSEQSLPIGAPTVLTNLLMVGFVAVPDAIASAQRARDMNALRQVGVACMNYAVQNKGQFPDTLEDLVKARILTKESLAALGPVKYYGKGQTSKGNRPWQTPLASLAPRGRMIAVVYADGHVSTTSVSYFQRRLGGDKAAAGEAAAPARAVEAAAEAAPAQRE